MLCILVRPPTVPCVAHVHPVSWNLFITYAVSCNLFVSVLFVTSCPPCSRPLSPWDAWLPLCVYYSLSHLHLVLYLSHCFACVEERKRQTLLLPSARNPAWWLAQATYYNLLYVPPPQIWSSNLPHQSEIASYGPTCLHLRYILRSTRVEWLNNTIHMHGDLLNEDDIHSIWAQHEPQKLSTSAHEIHYIMH